jgi:hypothetical protein
MSDAPAHKMLRKSLSQRELEEISREIFGISSNTTPSLSPASSSMSLGSSEELIPQ